MKRRYRFDEERGEMVEVSPDYERIESRAPTSTEGIVYGSLGTATDGTDISTRRRHREYMQRNGLTSTSDYSREFFNKAEKQRQEVLSGGGPAESRQRKEDIARAMYQLRRK